ncbi:MAG TPA: hypothetical protein DD429_01960 [Clostridiaceae bacterium]|nr:hypothetical protein [Clostridiaceae bacterium]
MVSGGFGSSILELISENNITGKNIKVMGFPDMFIPHGNVNVLFKKYNLDKNGIIRAIMKMV